MTADPVFVTGVALARSQDFAIVAFYAPSGDLSVGKVEAAETFRIVIGHDTLKKIIDTMSATWREIEASTPKSAGAAQGPERKLIDELSSGLVNGKH